jgi:hypothetical protein
MAYKFNKKCHCGFKIEMEYKLNIRKRKKNYKNLKQIKHVVRKS